MDEFLNSQSVESRVRVSPVLIPLLKEKYPEERRLGKMVNMALAELLLKGKLLSDYERPQ